jgi:hypothetical protein
VVHLQKNLRLVVSAGGKKKTPPSKKKKKEKKERKKKLWPEDSNKPVQQTVSWYTRKSFFVSWFLQGGKKKDPNPILKNNKNKKEK